MFGMLFTDVTDLALSDPQAAVAIATGDLVSVTFALVVVTTALVAVGCVIGVFQIRVVSRGIDKMTEASEKRDKRHRKTMKAEAKRHKKTMKVETRRHTEAMDAERNRHQEAMKALDALIRNSGRRNRPLPAR